MYEGGIHWINFLNGLGLDVQSVHGFVASRGDALERSMLVGVTYDGGAVGSLSYSWEVPSMLNGLGLSKISGSQGTITFESNGVFVFVNGRNKRLMFPGFSDIAGYKAMFADFIEALRAGREPSMNLQRARRDLEIVEQAYRTAKGDQ